MSAVRFILIYIYTHITYIHDLFHFSSIQLHHLVVTCSPVDVSTE